MKTLIVSGAGPSKGLRDGQGHLLSCILLDFHLGKDMIEASVFSTSDAKESKDSIRRRLVSAGAGGGLLGEH